MIARIFRSLSRSAILALSLFQVLAEFLLLWLRHRGTVQPAQRAQWLHRACALIVRRLDMRVRTRGSLPANGLAVSNHLSYLDVLFYAAVMPCIFVAKAEVRRWPCFGRLARCGGTIFVDRTRTASGVTAGDQMQRLLAANIPILLFPEGTSSDGSAVLRFHSSLFEPAVVAGVPVTALALSISDEDGSSEKNLCYYGEDTFAPHLFRTLGRRALTATLTVAPQAETYRDRKSAARSTWQQVTQMRCATIFAEDSRIAAQHPAVCLDAPAVP